MNIWTAHISKIRRQHPKWSFSKIIKRAKATYKKPTAWQKEIWREMH